MRKGKPKRKQKMGSRRKRVMENQDKYGRSRSQYS